MDHALEVAARRCRGEEVALLEQTAALGGDDARGAGGGIEGQAVDAREQAINDGEARLEQTIGGQAVVEHSDEDVVGFFAHRLLQRGL